ncbi:hypothetical protein [Gordonia sp. VNK21]|uniref:hypothetical protein n=1 Tax=Gordonia sp. VNK21 TaxID=3382483 RepID=UPI0038D43337
MGTIGAGDVDDAQAAALPRLAPGVPVLVRPDHAVHVGTALESALIWPVPQTAAPEAVAELIVALRDPAGCGRLTEARRAAGLTAADWTALLTALAAAGKIAPAPASSSLQIRVNGTGPLGRSLRRSLSGAGLSVLDDQRTPEIFDDAPARDCNLLVLADRTLIDPAVRLALMRSRTPHLLVGTDDRRGTVGPLVLPGLSSCLHCADLHRSEIDPYWPVIAPRLSQVPPAARPELSELTALLAHHEILGIAAALSAPDHPAPQTLDHRLSVRTAPAGTRLIPAPRHPRCSCRYPQGDGRESIERDHPRTGPPQCQAGLASPRHGRSRGRRRR